MRSEVAQFYGAAETGRDMDRSVEIWRYFTGIVTVAITGLWSLANGVA